MIVSKTPMRISFVGGGSDLPAYYRRCGSRVVSVSIDQYIYVTVTPCVNSHVFVNHELSERVKNVDDLHHPIVKACLKKAQVGLGVEITIRSDVLSTGTGLGTSSALTVGLLKALYAYKGKAVAVGQIAAQACDIEIKDCQQPIGKQDQYSTAFGGLNCIEFNQDDSVNVRPIACQDQTLEALQDNLLMMYTGLTQQASVVLAEQSKQLVHDRNKQALLSKMVALCEPMQSALVDGNLDDFASLLHKNWMLKRKLAAGITNPDIDAWYELARQNGALGGKLLGAGGRGFLMFYAPKSRHQHIIASLPGLTPLPVRFTRQGSEITSLTEVV